MESALCLRLRHGPLSPLPLRIPSPVKPATTTVTLLSLPLTNTKTSIIHRPLGHGFGPVCAINGFPKASTNDGGDGGKQIVKGSVGASLALACVLGIISCGCKMSPPVAIAASKAQKSISMSPMTNIYPGGGRLPLKSLLDMSVYLAASQDNQKRSVFSILKTKRIQPKDIEALKEDAIMQLKNSGKGDEVVKQLKEAYKSCKGDPEPETNVEMALVEVLILLGRYQEASKCKCLQRDLPSPGPSDARVPLYKAIIYTMLDNTDEARKWWKEYTRAVQGGIPFPEGS
ncbi:uncharacterized protein LOC132169447 [Corylus avellana]|uniref:uncharacterized protein LOC132169447 n=1 Tax=Corylus avellana TaxID=13451 RepID=UPI001E225979|nr:uncharacterized protein LOC132169447 [Corylus avellana]